MPFLQWPSHDPNDSKDYSIDWSQWLPSGDKIIASVWSAPSAITISVSSFTDTVSTVWLTGGGQAGSILEIQNKITTAQGRVCARTVTLQIVHS